jgi:hypothetical protein
LLYRETAVSATDRGLPENLLPDARRLTIMARMDL